MKVYVSGSNRPINLEQKDFVFGGGEGNVFIKGDIAYKIYHNPSKTIEPARITELQDIDFKNVIKPEKLILDENSKPIGYTMKAVHNTIPLSRLFTTEFRIQNNINEEQIYKLLQRIRETVNHLHEKNILIVDGNEMNYLVSEDFSEVYFIDVDSYQTRSFPAKAYSDSTLDPQVDSTRLNFSKKSDWFAFGIIACQLLLGIHPFKGTYKGTSCVFKRGDITARMKKNKSIFNANVKVNNAVRDFTTIPNEYLKWFESIFELGNREPAPLYASKTIVAGIINKQCQSNTLDVTEILSLDNPFVCLYSYQQEVAWKTTRSFILNGKELNYKNPDTHVVFSPRTLTPLLIKTENGELQVFNTYTNEISKEQLELKKCFVYQNRIYGISNGHIHEIGIIESNNKVLIVINTSDPIMPLATECFENVLVQHMMGAIYFSIPFASGSMTQIRIKEVEGKKVLNAKFENGLLGIIWYEKGLYKKALVKFNAGYTKYEIFQLSETDDLSFNFVVLDNGIVVDIPQDGEIQIFDSAIGKDNVKKVIDTNNNNQFKLAHQGMSLIGFNNKKAFKLKMK